MYWGTHIAVPVLGTAAVATWHRHRHPLWAGFAGMDYVLISLAALLPDLVDPHVYLSERILSPSHSAYFVVVMTALWAVMIRRDPWLWAAMSAALASHVALDACSGGVPLWHPFWDGLQGGPWIPQRFWLPADITSASVLVLVLLLHLRKVPKP